MSVVKVNPKLYGTCRLCLEDMGQYMIIPKVQEQIKYCFDITVEPFDGMPQLLCTNCERILREYFEVKKKFILKQTNLLNNINSISELENKDSEKTTGEKENSSTLLNNKLEKIVATEGEKSLSILVTNKTTTFNDKSNRNENESSSMLWPSCYKKQFACRLCNYLGRYKTSLHRHINVCHKNLKMNYGRILNKTCQVKIDKLDKKPNLTSVNNTVVISNDKIIQNNSVENSFCIIYTLDHSKKNRSQNDDESNECTVRKRTKTASTNNSLDLEKTETIELIDNAGKNTFHGECIYIEDSSHSESEEANTKSELSNTPMGSKYKVDDSTEEKVAKIKDIISACQKKYMENTIIHSNESHTKSQLKHKVLSIGRKIVNKQGFNCTGLLRYMEHKNLEILWTPYTGNSVSDSNVVRIMTKLRGHKEDEDELGWKTLPANTQGNLETVITKLPETQVSLQYTKKLLNENPVANPKQMPRKSLVPAKLNETSPPRATTQNDSNSPNETDKTTSLNGESSDSALLLPVTDISENINSNVGPPENNNKNNEVESSAARIKVKPLSELLSNNGLNIFSTGASHNSTLLSSDMQQNNLYTSMVLPNDIIHTTHLVQPCQIFQVDQMVAISSMAQPSPIVLTSPLAQPIVVSSSPMLQQREMVQENQPAQRSHGTTAVTAGNVNTEKRSSPAALTTHTEYVIMDTADLPNTKTHSPINYVKRLLQMHNIFLLDRKQDFSKNKPNCLIKFKVLYKQEVLDGAIVLSLSLLCHRNKFCMHIENDKKVPVVLTSISANWQWEIIRVFLGDVATKLLLNAQKINAETYEYTKTFLCLVKSINYRRQ